MTTRIATAIAAIAITVSVGALAAPAASAEPVTPAFGSVAFCLNVPLGPFLSFSVCI